MELKEFLTLAERLDALGSKSQEEALASKYIGQVVLVRTYSAGVHFGTLVTHAGLQVELTEARRIQYWEGACSLSEIALSGLPGKSRKDSRISVAVPSIVLTEAIEILPMTSESLRSLGELKTWKIANIEND